MDHPPTYNAVAYSDNYLHTVLTSLSEVKRKRKDLDSMMLKNTNERRDLQLKMMREENKMKESSKKLKSLSLIVGQLSEEYQHLLEQCRNAEDTV